MIRRKRDDLFKNLAVRSRPVRVQIELTESCNLRCIHCFLGEDHGPGDEIDADAFEKLLGQLRAAGVFHINLTGGEIFGHSQIERILDIALSSDFIITLQTNGTLVREEHIKKIAEQTRKIRCVAISLYGASPAVHERITGVPGSYAETLDTVKKCVASGVETEVSTLLMTANYHEMNEVDELCREIGVKHQFYSIVLPRRSGDSEPLKYRLPEEYLKNIPSPWETFSAGFEDIEPEDYAPEKHLEAWCTMGRTTCYIKSSGDVLPCSIVGMTAGNIHRESFTDIWKHSKVFKWIRSLKIGDFECSKCGNFPTCRPCPGLGFFEQGDIFAAPREMCRIARLFLGKEGIDNEQRVPALPATEQ